MKASIIKSMKNSKKKGMTLIELVIIVAILGIIAAIAAPQFTEMTANARASALDTNHSLIVSAVHQYLAAYGKLPPDEEAITPYISGISKSLEGLKDKPNGSTYTSDISGKATGSVTIKSTLSNLPTSFKAEERVGTFKDGIYTCETIITY